MELNLFEAPEEHHLGAQCLLLQTYLEASSQPFEIQQLPRSNTRLTTFWGLFNNFFYQFWLFFLPRPIVGLRLVFVFFFDPLALQIMIQHVPVQRVVEKQAGSLAWSLQFFSKSRTNGSPRFPVVFLAQKAFLLRVLFWRCFFSTAKDTGGIWKIWFSFEDQLITGRQVLLARLC